jgi:hypothetical protein
MRSRTNVRRRSCRGWNPRADHRFVAAYAGEMAEEHEPCCRVERLQRAAIDHVGALAGQPQLLEGLIDAYQVGEPPDTVEVEHEGALFGGISDPILSRKWRGRGHDAPQLYTNRGQTPYSRIGDVEHASPSGGKPWSVPGFFVEILEFAARFDPGFESAFKRTHPSVSAVDQHAGDTRRAGFIGSTAIDDHFAVRRYINQTALRIVHVNRYRAR